MPKLPFRNQAYVKTGFDIPAQVHEAVKRLAAQERRSISAQVTIMLEYALACHAEEQNRLDDAHPWAHSLWPDVPVTSPIE